LTSHLPPLDHVVKLRHRYAKNYPLEANEKGVFNQVELKMKEILTPIAKRLGYFQPENIIVESGIKKSKTAILLKNCGDGTICSRAAKLLNLNFTVINDRKFCKSASGNFSWGKHLNQLCQKILYEFKSIIV
jgi:hypothetical protein